MSSEEIVQHLDLVNKVASEYLKGSDPTEISKTLEIPRAKVMSLLTDWREMASSNDAIHARAREALAGADQHYSGLIKKAYEVIESADLADNLSAKNAAIKLITDIEAKRIDMLHRAGLLDNKEIAAEMAEMERKHEIVVGILRDVTSKCNHCKLEVMKRLSLAAGQNEVVVFDE